MALLELAKRVADSAVELSYPAGYPCEACTNKARFCLVWYDRTGGVAAERWVCGKCVRTIARNQEKLEAQYMSEPEVWR